MDYARILETEVTQKREVCFIIVGSDRNVYPRMRNNDAFDAFAKTHADEILAGDYACSHLNNPRLAAGNIRTSQAVRRCY